MRKRIKPATFALFAFPPILAAVFFALYPFSDVLVSRKISMSVLRPVQKSNIELAAKAINGVVLKPGEEFSFNAVVGPRTESRGYRPAPSYLGPESPATTGGGICLVSSALYQVALEAGLQVEQRVPHLRTIKTVPAGLDATVWYGQADLRFKNTLSIPVQVAADWSSQSLSVSLLGKRSGDFHAEKLERIVSRATPSEMVVELLRKEGDRVVLISRDHYYVAN